MKKVLSLSFCIIALVAFAIWAPNADAYMLYSEDQNEIGNCAACHGEFKGKDDYVSNKDGANWGANLHDGHTGGTNIDSSCGNCHWGTGTSNRQVNLGSSQDAADGINAISCMGCHQGPGLREHHDANGITECVDCHGAVNPPTENVAPPWYGSVTNLVTGTNLEPCNLNGEENFNGTAIGLDNDGDNCYDSDDTDCGGPGCEGVCGDGTVDPGEDCDDGNTQDGDCCSAICEFEPSGSECGDQVVGQCDNPDSCDGAGTCDPNYVQNGTTCNDNDVCTDPDSCTDGLCSGVSLLGDEGPPGDPTCADECDNDGDTLIDLADPECQEVVDCGNGVLDPDELCDPSVAGTVCCEADCTYSPSTTACGDPSDTECDAADTCAGDAAVCNQNIASVGTACGDQGEECLVDDACDGQGACTDNGNQQDGTPCGSASDTDCDNPDSCLAGSCDPNYEPTTTACEDGEFCTDGDACDGSGTCAGGAGSPCLPDETCDEDNNICVPPAECTPGETRTCDTGQLGVCAAGTETCDANGTWGDCVQDVQPSAEICDDSGMLDEDCDGLANADDPDCVVTEGDVWLDQMRAPKSKRVTNRRNTVNLEVIAKGDGNTTQMAMVCIETVPPPDGVIVTFTGGGANKNCDTQLIEPGNGRTTFTVPAKLQCQSLDDSTYPVNWKATISAPENSDTSNDTMMRTTNIKCVQSKN